MAHDAVQHSWLISVSSLFLVTLGKQCWVLKHCRINHIIYQNKPFFSTCRKWCALLKCFCSAGALECRVVWLFCHSPHTPLFPDVTCGAAPEIPNGRIAGAPQERYLPDARVHYQCDSNFQMTGANYVFCSNGQWSQAPVCRGRNLCFPLAC